MLHEARYAAVSWPTRFGGRDASLWEWLIFARPLVHRAAHSLAVADEDRSVHVAAAKMSAAQAAERAAHASLQCHGAIGYTVEHGLHLFLKRIWGWPLPGEMPHSIDDESVYRWVCDLIGPKPTGGDPDSTASPRMSLTGSRWWNPTYTVFPMADWCKMWLNNSIERWNWQAEAFD